MLRTSLWIAVLVLFAVLPSAQAVQIQSLYCYVYSEESGREDTYDVEPGVHIPVSAGETVEISLYGVTGADDIRLPATFVLAAGQGHLQVVDESEDSITVYVKGGGNAQLAYEIDGDYGMRGGLREGRLTFEIE